MAKKVDAVFEATLVKNMEKGGAWLATVTTHDAGIDEGYVIIQTSWANASAGKRWIKEKVQSMTPRKSIKMAAGTEVDAKGKPISWAGQVTFKREA